MCWAFVAWSYSEWTTVSGEQNVVAWDGNAVTLLVETSGETTIGSRQ